MSILTVNDLSTTVDRAVQRINIADSKVTRALAVLLVLGSSAFVGLLALATLLCILGGAYLSGLLTAAVAVIGGVPAVLAFAWLKQIDAEHLF